jgi:hypothetical protein
MSDGPSAREFYGEVFPYGVHIELTEEQVAMGLSSRDVVVAIDNRPINRKGYMPGDARDYVPSEVFTEEVQHHLFDLVIFQYETKRLIRWELPSKSRGGACRSLRTILREARTEYALVGGYIFFDVNYMSVHELFTHTSAGHPIVFDPEVHGGELLFFEDEPCSDMEEAQLEELYEIDLLYERLLPLCHDPRQKGIMVYRSIPGEATDGNSWGGTSIVETCNGKPVKTLRTLLKYAQENPIKKPFLIITCENGRVICIEKNKIHTHRLPGRLNPNNIG